MHKGFPEFELEAETRCFLCHKGPLTGIHKSGFPFGRGAWRGECPNADCGASTWFDYIPPIQPELANLEHIIAHQINGDVCPGCLRKVPRLFAVIAYPDGRRGWRCSQCSLFLVNDGGPWIVKKAVTT